MATLRLLMQRQSISENETINAPPPPVGTRLLPTTHQPTGPRRDRTQAPSTAPSLAYLGSNKTSSKKVTKVQPSSKTVKKAPKESPLEVLQRLQQAQIDAVSNATTMTQTPPDAVQPGNTSPQVSEITQSHSSGSATAPAPDMFVPQLTVTMAATAQAKTEATGPQLITEHQPLERTENPSALQ